MSVPLHPTLRSSIWVVAVPLALYTVFLALGMNPFFQRNFVYAHRINSLFFNDINKPEKWGFAKNQVTPFGLQTADGESLYAWHILPLPLYLQNEGAISSQPSGFAQDFTATESFRLLKEDPEARVVLYFHGNAGHIAEGFRPASYHTLTATSPYHLVAIDYRGFSHSSGAPTETGLIEDASAVVNWTLTVAGIPPDRVVLLGQSLGTAVVSGVAERYVSKGVEFAGIILVSGFSDLALMLSEYRVAGLFPVLAPFRSFPTLLQYLRSFVVDKWRSDIRLASLVRNTKERLRLTLIHAKNDPDIPWTQDNKLFRAAVNEAVKISEEAEFDTWKESRTVHRGNDSFVATWESGPNMVIRQELVPFGGHNNIMTYSAVPLAIMRSFNSLGTST